MIALGINPNVLYALLRMEYPAEREKSVNAIMNKDPV